MSLTGRSPPTGRAVVVGNHSTGSLNAHTGSGPQNINTAGGDQYNANAIYHIERYYPYSSKGQITYLSWYLMYVVTQVKQFYRHLPCR